MTMRTNLCKNPKNYNRRNGVYAGQGSEPAAYKVVGSTCVSRIFHKEILIGEIGPLPCEN